MHIAVTFSLSGTAVLSAIFALLLEHTGRYIDRQHCRRGCCCCYYYYYYYYYTRYCLTCLHIGMIWVAGAKLATAALLFAMFVELRGAKNCHWSAVVC